MTQRDRNDAILVKIVTYKDDHEEMISSYYTTAFDQTLKMFITSRDYEIPCVFNEYSEVIEDIYQQMDYIIEDVQVGFGSRDDMPIIKVII